MEAIILAGGKGTRLRSVLASGIPKPLADVGGRPFLDWLLEELAAQGVTRVVMSVGWNAEAIVRHCGDRFQDVAIDYATEDSPLGTGGAIRLAMGKTHAPEVLVLNGDTFLQLSFLAMLESHRRSSSSLTIACVSVPDVARYGRVFVERGQVYGFAEKGRTGPGIINGGSYVLNRSALDGAPDGPFSFESDFLAPRIGTLRPNAYPVAGGFLDIGVPEDLERAKHLLPAMRR